MSSRRVNLALLVAALAYCPAAIAQEQSGELNARDAFWSAADLVGKRPVSASATAKTVKPSVKHVRVSAPLGLRYAVLKQKTDSTYQDISPGAVFHAGDRIRLSLMSNNEGYLYVIEQGSSGKWIPLYPTANATAESNKLSAGKEYIVPGKGAWEFKGDAGQERLFVLLSHAPETSLAALIASLRDRQSSIDDGVVSQLRSEVKARDLVFSSGDDQPSEGGDQATYVINKASRASKDPRVVVDVVLAHK